ncbi:hypothetical protein [Paeniglutamicibacter gangotriensis]|nr:hypothetical protein [Paeniglutamicibacter gangotriensis]
MDKVHSKTKESTPGGVPKALVGPLTLRDVIVVLGGVAVIVGSLVPIPWTERVSVNMWIFPGLPFHFFVALLLPLLVAGGFAWRRLTGRTRVRVGSLSLDQAGSVISLFAAAYFFNSYVASMSPAYLIGFIGALAMVVGTTLTSYLGAFRSDFVAGGESVLGSDVAPLPASAQRKTSEAKDAAVPTDGPTDSSDDEGFGASSASPGAGRTANRPGVPLSGKNVAPVATTDDVSSSGPSESSVTSASSTSDSVAHASAASKASTHVPAKSAAAASGAAAGSAVVPTPGVKDTAVPASASATKSAADATGDRTTQDKSASSTTATDAGEHPAAKATSETKDSSPEGASTHTTGATSDHAKKNPAARPVSGAKSASVDQDAKSEAAQAAQGQTPKPETADATSDATPSAEEKTPAAAGNTDDAASSVSSMKPGSGSLDPESAPKAAETKSGSETKPGSETASAKGPEAVSLAPAAAAPENSSTPANQATSAVPRVTGDIKATAALSRVELDEHRAAAERTKAEAKAKADAEAESSFGARSEQAAAQPVPTSFWFALNHSRPVYHPANGTMLASLQPGAWILCLEDRGNEYLINMADGRPAVLRNLDDLQFPEN